MVAKYSVKIGDRWYRAGDTLPPSPAELVKLVPLQTVKKEPDSQAEPEAKPEEAASKRELVGENEKKPTKQAIIKCSVAELREWVARLELSGNTVNMNGPQLRALLFRHYKV